MISRLARACALLALFALSATACRAQPSEEIQQLPMPDDGAPPLVMRSFDEALAEAEQRGKHVLVNVFATWCPFCRKLDTETLTDPAVRRYLDEHFVFARLNGDTTGIAHTYQGQTYTGKELAGAFGTRGYPNNVFLTPEGEPITKQAGFLPPEAFLERLEYVASGAYRETAEIQQLPMPDDGAPPLVMKSFDEAVADAEASGKYVFVNVFATWCPYCRKFDTETLVDPAVRRYLDEHFEVARLDGDVENQLHTFRGQSFTGKELAAAFGTTGFPNNVFLTSEGEPITRLPGFVPPDMFAQILEFIGSGAYQSQTFQEFTESSD